MKLIKLIKKYQDEIIWVIGLALILALALRGFGVI